MDEKQLKAAIRSQITSATGYLSDEINQARADAMRDYLGEPLGNEIDGRSQVISTDTQDVIESIMPDLIQVFTASDKAVRYEPVGPEDEAGAAQATEYANYVWHADNAGFTIFHDWFKDALLQKTGIIKIWWDETDKVERRQYTGLSADHLALLMDEKDVEVIEHDERWSEEAEQFLADNGLARTKTAGLPPELAQQGRVHDVTIKRKRTAGRIRIENVPPEDFLISRRAKSADDAPFMAHFRTWTQSELIEAGYDTEQVKDLPTGSGNFYNEEKTARYTGEADLNSSEADRATREIDVYECYLRIDWDGDDIAELRKVMVAGPSHEILKFKGGELDNEAISDHPFASITPIRMPHKFFGRSMHDLVQDIQRIKTALWRQALDNAYNVNNARAAISRKVSMEDYLDNKVGGPIRIDADTVAGHIQPIISAPIGNQIYPLLEYVDTIRETRTGVNRLSQGLDPDALKNTATGINQLLGRAQQRTLLIAQVFAFGVRDAFKKILRLSTEHQDKARVIRLRNQWVEIDPRSWNAEMDVTVDVGLGRGTRDQQIMTASKVIEATMALVGLQGGLNGPFIYAHHVRNAYAKFYESIGIKSADSLLADVSEEMSAQIAQQAGQQPNPEMMQAQVEQGKTEMEMQRMQMDGELKTAEMQSEHEIKVTAQQLEHIRKLIEFGHKQEAAEAKLQLDAYIANRKIEVEQFKAVSAARSRNLQAVQRYGGRV